MVIAFYDSDPETSHNCQQKCQKKVANGNNGKENEPQDNEGKGSIEISTQGCPLSSSKHLIGNSKRFRIENNKKNIQIIGNNNRIKINTNYGDIQIIGNNNKLKILENVGGIKYTGNNGRISIGSDSVNQFVDYIGCNGTLKIFNPLTFNMKSEEVCLNNLKKADKNSNKNRGRSHSGGCVHSENTAFYLKSCQSTPNLNLNLNLNLNKCWNLNSQFNKDSSKYLYNANHNLTIFQNLNNIILGNQINIIN